MRDLKDRLASLEEKVKKSKLMMKRPNGETYERLVDVVCDIDERLEKLES